MNRLFKYILLLIIAACGLSCSEEVDLTTYKALEIEYVTSNRQAISNLRQWYGGDSYSIIADTYQENSNRGSLFVYPDVSTFGLWFQGCENLTEVYIPGGISSIGLRAFEKCANLKSVTIPDSVTTIGQSAFAYCYSLTSVTIPDRVTTIEEEAFGGCSSLTSVYCTATTPPSLVGDFVFYNNASDRKIYVPSKSIIAYRNAKGWSEYADAIIGYNFETGEVDKDPLDELTNNKIYYTNGSTTTPTEPYVSSVFGANIVSNRYDSSLKCWAITFDADLTMIGDYAFYDCGSLTSVTIPDSVTTIGDSAFYDCDSLTSITIPDSVTTIGGSAFRSCSSLPSVTIPDSVTTIGDYAFAYCSSLTSVTIGDGVITIGNSTFYNCSSLTSVTIPDSVTTIGNGAFSLCTSLTSVTIPDSVTTIGNNAFYNCSSLTSVTIPNSVTTIGDKAFLNCSSLISVYCAASTPPVLGGNYVFDGNGSDRKIYVPTKSVDAYKSAEYWSEYADAIVGYNFETGEEVMPDEMRNRVIYYTATRKVEAYSDYPWTFDTFGANVVSNEWNSKTGEGVITFDGDVTTIGNWAFYNCDSLKSVTMPDGVTTIGDYAFYNCDSLTSITIPDSVMTIGDFTFNNCTSLTSVTIPDSVTTIGDYAFSHCSSLTSVTIPNSVTTIGDGAFIGCHSITEFKGKFAEDTGRILVVDGTMVAFAPAELTEYTIPGSVTTIGIGAFQSCTSLTSVTIPDSVTTIGSSAFYGCSSLTSVTIGDSVTTIGYVAFCYCSSLTSVTIPDSVTTIGSGALYNCTSLTSVYCTATTPPSLGGDSVFDDNASDRKIYVPSQSVESYKSAEYWTEYADAIVGYNFETGEEVMPDEMRNRVIYYTATRKVEAHSAYPWTYDTFGANIVSHEWNSETGEGVITFDTNVSTIGEYAFYYCYSLTSVTIPDSVTTIGSSAFAFCNSLTEFNGKFASEDCRCLIVDGTLNSFAIGCGATEYTIPDSVTTIGGSAFLYCSSLTSITIGDSVTTIGDYAFDDCSSLTSIAIPDSVTTIGDYAFSDCSSLTSVYCEATTPPSLGGYFVFYNNASGRTIYVPSQSVESYKSAEYWTEYADAIVGYDFETGEEVTPEEMRNRVIYYTATAKVEAYSDYPWTFDTFGANILSHDFNEESGEGVIIFDADVTRIDSSAFRNCEGGLISIVIPNSVTVIGNYAFVGCDDLVSIDFGEGVTWIGNAAFSGCESLASVVLPDSVEIIRELAFINCSRITSVIIGKSVGRIEAMAFDGCESLVSVYCKPNTPPSADLGQYGEWYAFSDNASNRKIYVPTQSVTTYKQRSGWKNYADAIVGYDFNTTITPDGGIDDAEEDDEVIL